ncbi:telomere-protecting terminal protein Tpg [Streptomyces sp. NPDC101145]|uniref:telomere-protecting terminal protein Tpg n=1 Tax=Streptomyces sp. NPDC101145 TaxID=3366112 RepID=UPI00380EB0B3
MTAPRTPTAAPARPHHGRHHHPDPAWFEYTAPIRTTDDSPVRRVALHLPPEYAQRLFDTRGAGTGERQLRQIIAEGLQDIYFKDGGRRADDLERQSTDIDYLDLGADRRSTGPARWFGAPWALSSARLSMTARPGPFAGGAPPI